MNVGPRGESLILRAPEPGMYEFFCCRIAGQCEPMHGTLTVR